MCARTRACGYMAARMHMRACVHRTPTHTASHRQCQTACHDTCTHACIHVQRSRQSCKKSYECVRRDRTILRMGASEARGRGAEGVFLQCCTLPLSECCPTNLSLGSHQCREHGGWLPTQPTPRGPGHAARLGWRLDPLTASSIAPRPRLRDLR